MTWFSLLFCKCAAKLARSCCSRWEQYFESAMNKKVIFMSYFLPINFYNFSLNKIIEGRKIITTTLDKIGLKYTPSNTNFVFFHSKRHIDDLGKQMLERGVKIGRPFPPFYDWCRISIGTLEETKIFARVLENLYLNA